MAQWRLNKALVKAIGTSDLAGAKKALERGADPNHRFGEEQGLFSRPLLLCGLLSEAISKQFIQLLLSHGADVNIRGNHGETALHVIGSPEQVEALLDGGADVGAVMNGGETPLHIVADMRACQLLLDAGADPTALNDLQQMPHESMIKLTNEMPLSDEDRAKAQAMSGLLRSMVEGDDLERSIPQVVANPEVQVARKRSNTL